MPQNKIERVDGRTAFRKKGEIQIAVGGEGLNEWEKGKLARVVLEPGKSMEIVFRCYNRRCDKKLAVHRGERLHQRKSVNDECWSPFPTTIRCRGCGAFNQIHQLDEELLA